MPLGHFFHDWSLKVTHLKKLDQKSIEKPDEREKNTQKKYNFVLLFNSNNINMSERTATSKVADSKSICNICALSSGSRQGLSLFLFITASMLQFRPQYRVCPSLWLGCTY